MNKTIKKLEIISSIQITNYDTCSVIYDYIKENDFVFSDFWHVDMKWFSCNFKTQEQINKYITKQDNWRTYGDCRSMFIKYINENEVNIIIEVYTKDFEGFKTKEWRVTFHLPIEIIANEEIKKYIESNFRYYLSNKYDEYLEIQREKWMNEMEKKLINDEF